jgi:polar amino acid transport system substrate-binding protein
MRRSLRVWLAAALALLSVASAGAARAQTDSPVLARIVKAGELRVGMSGDQPPLNFKSKGGEMMGLEVDLARALAEVMGVKLVIVQKPFDELLGAVKGGQVDLVMSGMTITPARNMQVPFVGPYYLSGKSILASSATLAKIKSLGDLDKPKMTLVALDGSTSQVFVEKLLPKAKLVTAKTYADAVKLLLANKAQALVADQEICVLTGLRNPKAGLGALSKPLTVEPIGIAVAPGDPLLVNFLENSFAALQVGGSLDALRGRWIENGDWVSQLP